MIDIKLLEQEIVLDNLNKRQFYLNKNEYLELKNKIHQLKMNIEAINARANKNTQLPEDKENYKILKKEILILQPQLDEIVWKIPNLLHETVPTGKGAQDNIVIKQGGHNKEGIHDYLKIANQYGLNIEKGVDQAGARFLIMNGKVAKLHRKIINDAMNYYEKLGYEQFYVPYLVNQDIAFGTGQYPKFEEEMFTTQNGDQKLYLIPTGEVPLTNTVRNTIFNEDEVEKKMMTHTPCFRQEVGAHGKDTKGIIRQHQFEKVELVRTCMPENGLMTLEQMVHDIEELIKTFDVKWRIIELCAGDIGFAGHKAYDFELWFAGEQRWREIATVTWCHDFQARRMNAKFKKNNKKEFLHTLNGTGLAAGRVLAALIEEHGENAFY